MADQISIQIAEPQVAAGSAVTATVNFRTRSTAAASTPGSIRYRVDCLTNKRNVVNWTSVAASSSVSVSVPGTSNGTIDSGNEFETRQLTVEMDTGLDTQLRQAATWRVRTIRNYVLEHAPLDSLLLEAHYPKDDDIESGLTIEHHQFPVGHRFRYLDTFDVLDAHYYRRTAAEVSAGVTPTNYQYEPGDVRRYGADITGSNPSSVAFDDALSSNDYVFAPAGTYLFDAKVVIPDGVVLDGVLHKTVIRKGFNGDVLEVSSFASVNDLDIDGDQDNYTGRGIIITEGTNPTGGYQHFRGVRVYNTESYNVEYTADGVGFDSMWEGCWFYLGTPDDPSNGRNDGYCIKHPTDTGTGNRHYLGCHAPADSLIDISNSVNTNLHGCFSGRSAAGSLWCLGFSANSAQSVINGCRLAGGGQTGTIRGTLHTLVGCDIAATGITFDTGAASNKFLSNSTGAITWTDNSGSTGTSANEFDTTVISYAPTWTGASSNPAIGDGSISGSYTRQGRMVTLSFRVNMGSTTTYGTGEWRFSLPFTAHNRNYMGSVRALDSGTNYITGVVQINEGNATYCTIYFDAAAAAASATIPITWASGDEVWATIAYDV